MHIIRPTSSLQLSRSLRLGSFTSLGRTKGASGFTIIELLVVIVVIAILAAITIVAYRGISQRAIVSSLSSDLDNASKQLKLAQIDSGNYPVANDCSTPPAPNTICLKASPNTTYQYTVNNSTTPPTFCLTATNGSTSYFTTNDATPQVGGCPGHSVGGGTVITNLILDPSFESGTSSGGAHIGSSSSSRSVIAGAASFGSKFLRCTFATSPAGDGWGQFSGDLQPGIYTGSFWVRSSEAISFNRYFEGSATKTTVASGGNANLVPNVWTQLWMTVNVTSVGTLKVGGYVTPIATLGSGDTLDFDGIMLTQGSTPYSYADPITNPTSWVWNGTSNNSTSTGPAL